MHKKYYSDNYEMVEKILTKIDRQENKKTYF